ncbi:hypothetical protein LPJ76_000753 [Coemansia sp. RSA 638]|nr:hypothetical protein LPJ76_000753 [Coemansia sp. RSA 638]
MLGGLQSQLAQRPRLRLFLREFGLLAAAWGSLAVVVVWMALCQEWSDMRWLSRNTNYNRHKPGNWNLKHSGYKMLDDIVLDQIPLMTERWITDAVVNSAALIAVGGGMVMARGWQARLVYLRRIAWMMATLYFLRSITISVTTLPPSVNNCKPQVAHNTSELVRIVPLMISGQLSGCTDKVFSGHTSILMISFLFWTRYARHWAFVAYSAVHTLLGIGCVLAVRLHYSVDVLLAVVLTFSVHHMYYLLLECAVRQRYVGLPRHFLHGSTAYSPGSLASRQCASSEIDEIELTESEISSTQKRGSVEQKIQAVYTLGADFDDTKSTVDASLPDTHFNCCHKEENYEQILSSLEQDIRRAEKQRALATERMEWWAHNWVFYTGIGWLAYVVGFILYVWPERHGSHSSAFLMHATLVATIPLAVYYGNVAIRTLCQRFISRHDSRIARLRAELKERLDELKKKTAFETTKTLIDRYSNGEKNVPAEQGPTARLRQQEAKNRRRTMPNFGTPGTHAGGNQPVPATSPLAAKSAQMHGPQRQVLPGQLTNSSGPQQAVAAQPVHRGETGVVKVAPHAAAQQTGNARPWLDKLVDQLVGDVGSENDKYALICRHCYAHNGLVLEEEIRDIQYTCPKCHKFNPSLRALNAGASLQQQPAKTVTAPDVESEKKGANSNYAETGNEDEDTHHSDDQDDIIHGDESDSASDDGCTPISTPVAQNRTLRAKPSKESLEQPVNPPTHARKTSKTKPSPRKRKGAANTKRS